MMLKLLESYLTFTMKRFQQCWNIALAVVDVDKGFTTDLGIGGYRTGERKMTEIWKVIPNYENYQVSNLGRVKGPLKMLKPSLRKSGYVYMNLTVNSKNISKSLHRLVALSFLGQSNLDVDHINGDKTDNRLCNLRYVTSRENNLLKKNVKGYHKCTTTGRWKTEIYIDGKRIWLGRYDSEKEAKQVYDKAKLKAVNKNSKGLHI
jgi:hypothetical protein